MFMEGFSGSAPSTGEILLLDVLGVITFILALLVTRFLWRERKKPVLMQIKQLIAVICTAVWCSAVAVSEAVGWNTMIHPYGAVAKTLLFSLPGLLLGGTAIWWFSPWRTRQRPGKVGQLW
jgi:hypothetical protein